MISSVVPKDYPVLGAWLIGALVGGFLGYERLTDFLTIKTFRYEPLPHLISKYPGGISLRFAMVHDVIHERFPLHGEAYYRRRNAMVGEQLEKLGAESKERWRLMDDLAVGCMHLGEFDQAISTMRDKLARQERDGIKGVGLYSTYANLGTAMMIDAIVKSSAGKDSSDELRESLIWVRKSIEVNPEAHFGREVWQVVLGEFLLAAAKDPKLLEEYDFIGNELDRRIYYSRAIDGRPAYLGRVMPTTLDDSKITSEARARARGWIMPAGAGLKWTERAHTSNERPVPFDEPVLGIVGMWRYGGGANPFFSLALAETMLRVGQSHIAWSAYERTTMLLAGLPDKERAKWLMEHCRSRQGEIESKLSERAEDLRAAFKADLKAGLDYQAAYQKYEAERIGKGNSIDDPHFYDAFLVEHAEIASEPGVADSQKVVTEDFGSRVFVPALLMAGIFAFVTAMIRWSSRKAG